MRKLRWTYSCRKTWGGSRAFIGWKAALGRLPSQKKEVSTVEIRNGLTWASGVTGMNIFLPETACLNATVLLELMPDVLGMLEWVEVRGPDAIVLR